MRACGTCGTQNSDGARFCVSCGASLVPACPVCGAEVPAGARFCPACGHTIADPEARAGQERRLVTVLFCDVTGSTGLGEQLDPERLQEVLATYFAAMREEIEAEGGTVEKFIGDAVMAAFGVPTAHEDDPSRALRAALRMRQRLDEVNAGLQARFGVSLRIRTGVNTGEVLAAPNPLPGEPMVTGDAVNVAARLEQTAEPGEIVVAERTARAARGFRFHELGEQELRGKEQAVPAVLLEDEVSSAPERGVPGLRAPMVGRDSELELLRSVYQRSVAEARPNLVTIYGDPGVGKSRLTAEFVTWAMEQTPAPRIVRGRCLPYGDGVTYWPLAEILKDLAQIRDTDPPAMALERIRALGQGLITSEMATNPAKATAALGYSVGVEDPEFGFRAAEPREVRLKIHAAWRSLFSALSARAPVIAVIDDIHWADPALLDLLEELADRIVGPVVFLCPARLELTERRPGWGGGRRNLSSVALDPLTPAEADQLVGFLLAIDALPAPVRAMILERAEGNPFFLEEIVRHLIDEGRIVREGGRWRAAPDIGDVAIPDTVQAVLAARIDLLDPVEKRALQRAAVVGRVFWPGPVGRLLNGDREHLRDTLDRLEDRELVLSRLSSSIAGEQEFIFKHILTREVAYESLPRRERAGAHAAVASWIEETAGERSREFLELLAYHHLEAYTGARDDIGASPRLEDLRRRAFESLLDVAREARSRFALQKATATADRAFALATNPLERIVVLEEIGLIARSDYQGDLSWRSFKEAVDLRLVHEPGERRAIALACAGAAENPLRWPGSMKDPPSIDEVKRYLDVGFEHLEDEDTEGTVLLLTLRAFEPFGFGWQTPISAEERERALADGIRAAELARSMGRLDLESAALDGAGSSPLNVGMYGQIGELVRRRLEIADLIEDPWETGDIYGMGAWHHGMLGEYEEAVRIGLLGSDLGKGAEGLAAHCMNWAGASLFHLGDWDRVLEVFRDLQANMGERANDPPYFVMNLFGAAAFVLEARGLAGADRLLDLLARSRGSIHGGSVMASHWLAWAVARRGEHERAWDLVHEAKVESMTVRPFQDEVEAELLAITARWDQVPQFLVDSRTYASEAELLALPVHLERLEGRAALAVGDLETGIVLMERARDGFSRLGAAWERARTELDLAEAFLSAGRQQDVRRNLEAATPDIERVGALLEIERTRDLSKRLGP